ncbi:MAG TPA: hypothetical protein VNF69_03865 [Burkholderiales bacterium]|nr:hypothetical protein [Burkholderiales bacterium]
MQEQHHSIRSPAAPENFDRQVGILDSEIPLGGSGRRLTAPECSKLRQRGVSCDERYIVVRVAVDTPGLGYLYEPVHAPERHARVGVVLG